MRTEYYLVRMPADMPYEIRAELNAWYVESEPIVRCRDCVHFTANDEFWLEPPQVPFPMIGATCDSCDLWARTKCKVEPDGFCAWGKRKVVE